MKRNRAWLLSALMLAATVLISGFTTHSPVAPQQELMMLERRLNTIEQRFYSLESRLNRIEQQQQQTRIMPQPAEPPPAAGQNMEMRLLQSEIDLVRSRLRLVECGVVRLDERTLSERAREARKKAGAQLSDSCRVNAETPLEFPRQ